MEVRYGRRKLNSLAGWDNDCKIAKIDMYSLVKLEFIDVEKVTARTLEGKKIGFKNSWHLKFFDIDELAIMLFKKKEKLCRKKITT